MRFNTLGRFGKGVEGSVSLNFCEAGGRHCSKQCKMNPQNGGRCYAPRFQKMYPSVWRGLKKRGATPPAEVVWGAITDIVKSLGKGVAPKWFRFSVVGSLPHKKGASEKFKRGLRRLAILLRDNNIPMHMPVETPQKRELYYSLVGDMVAVRESCQSLNRWLSAPPSVDKTIVVGEEFVEKSPSPTIRGLVKLHGIRKMRKLRAITVARENRKRTGKPTYVCPAIRGVSSRKRKWKCGECKACSMRGVDIVYPLH